MQYFSKLTRIISLHLVIIMFLIPCLLGWGPNIKDYTVARSLPKPPNTTYNLSSQNFYPSATVEYRTNLEYEKLLQFYQKELPEHNWVYDSTPWSSETSKEIILRYKKNILEKTYYVEIPITASDNDKTVEDNLIKVVHGKLDGSKTSFTSFHEQTTSHSFRLRRRC